MKRIGKWTMPLSLIMTVLMMTGTLLLAQGSGGNSKKQVSIEIAPALAELNEGEQVQFSAVIVDSKGSPVEGAIEWSVLNKNVGEIDQNGLFTAVGGGHTCVLARYERSVGRAEILVYRDPSGTPQVLRGLKVFVRPAGVTLVTGGTEQFTASLVDSLGNTLEAEFTWGVDGEFGSIDESGLFEALETGRGFVYAETEGLSGRAHVLVKDSGNGNNGAPRRAGTKLVVVPSDTLILIGNAFQYQAFLVDSLGNRTEAYPEWSLLGRNIGTMTETGLLTADSSGNAVIKAQVDRYTATARVRVASVDDTANASQVEFKMKKRDGLQVGNLKRIDESDVFKISGMPFPLNLLNGTEVTLPAGSLDENITIDVTIPSLAEVREDTVSLPDAILNGVSFNVYVDGELVSPYVFDEPVQLVIPYKQTLLDDLGLTVDDLWIYFYTDSAGYDDAGIFNVYVDSSENKIYVEVTHFSEIILGKNTLKEITGVASEALPGGYSLDANYPNPFNPETMIRFDVAGNTIQHLSLTIYNLLGQEIRILASQAFSPGRYQLKWDGRDQQGRLAGTGVYIYRLEGEHVHLSSRMMMIR